MTIMALNEGRRPANSHEQSCGMSQLFSPSRIRFALPVEGAAGNSLHRKYHPIRYFGIPQTGEPILRLSGLWLHPVVTGGAQILRLGVWSSCSSRRLLWFLESLGPFIQVLYCFVFVHVILCERSESKDLLLTIFYSSN